MILTAQRPRCEWSVAVGMTSRYLSVGRGCRALGTLMSSSGTGRRPPVERSRR